MFWMASDLASRYRVSYYINNVNKFQRIEEYVPGEQSASEKEKSPYRLLLGLIYRRELLSRERDAF